MKIKMDFYNDLNAASIDSANFLREKHVNYNKTKTNQKEKVYSKEHEFVAEVYRQLVNKDIKYRTYLCIDHLHPEDSQEKRDSAPDLVYEALGYKAVVEIKTIVVKKVREDPGLFKHDLDRVEADYTKLQMNSDYVNFNQKILIVAYLGEESTERDEIQNVILAKFPEKNGVRVIVC